MFINSAINLDKVTTLAVTLDLSSNYAFWAGALGASLSDSRGVHVATINGETSAQGALDDLLTLLGEPWTAIGDISGVGAEQDPWVLAVNLANVIQFSDDSGNGVVFNGGWASKGYSPWSNFSTAEAGLLALLGTVSFG